MVLDRASCDLDIIERDGVIGELLIIFVPLACDQDDVARLSECDCAINRLRAIDHFFIATRAKAFLNLDDNRVRVLFARIIGGDNRVISMSIHYFAHQRTLFPVAIAAAAKNYNQSMRLEFPQSLEDVLERIRCVRVIDKNLELSLRRN